VLLNFVKIDKKSHTSGQVINRMLQGAMDGAKKQIDEAIIWVLYLPPLKIDRA